MAAINYERQPQLPNPSATAARAVLGSLIGCLVWTAASVLMALNQDRAPQVQHGVLAIVMYGGVMTACFSAGLLVGYFGFRSNARRTEKLRRAILDGQFLARWTYPAAQWRQFRQSAIRSENAKRAALRFGTGFFIIVPLIVGAIVGVVRPGHDTAAIVIIVGMCGACALVSTIVLLGHARFDALRRQRLLTPQDTYLSTLGAHANGRWVLWGTAQHRLSDIRIDPGKEGAPACLEFVIDLGESLQCERVLIPADRMELARRVVEAVKQAPDAEGGGGLNTATSILRGLTQALGSFR